MQNKVKGKRKQWWQRLERWLYNKNSHVFYPIALLMIYWLRGLPIWVLFFSSMYLLYGCVYSYKNNSSVKFGFKEFEKATHPALYFVYYVLFMLVILIFIFFDVAKFISSVF